MKRQHRLAQLLTIVLCFSGASLAQTAKATFPINAPPNDQTFYIIRTVDNQEALFVATQNRAINGTRLGLKTAANEFSHWQFLLTGNGERFLRAKKSFPVPGSQDAVATNADVDHAQWTPGTYVVIAVQAAGQTWEAEDTGDGNGSFYLKSLLGRHTGKSGDLYMGYTEPQTDPIEGRIRWVKMQPKDLAAKWWFVPVN